MHLKTITEILGIDNFKVQSIIFNFKETLALYLTPIKNVAPKCSGCGRSHDSIHGSYTVTVRDMRISGKDVLLVFKKRQVRCPEDESIRVEEFDWLRGNVTKRYAQDVYKLTSITTNTEAAWYLGLDDEKVYRIDKSILEELASEKLEPIPSPENISVDEVAWQKWHKYVTNVVDVDSRKVIWNSMGREKTTLNKFYNKLGKDACLKIKSAAMDGAKGYISSTKEKAPSALIVYDKFHINQKLNNAIDEVRKAELRKARQNDDNKLRDLTYCGERWLLLKNKDLTKNQSDKLAKLLEINENIAIAKILKDDFLSIYDLKNPKEAEDKLVQWLVDAESSQLEPLKALAESFLNKSEYILNYFIKKISSAISEGINNKIKRLKRMAYGYRDPVYFLLKIHQHCGLLSPRFST